MYHDVTGRKSPNVCLDYFRLIKMLVIDPRSGLSVLFCSATHMVILVRILTQLSSGILKLFFRHLHSRFLMALSVGCA